MRSAALAVISLQMLGGGAFASAQMAAEKVPVVAVTGCVVADGPGWALDKATEPLPSIANGPAAGDAIKGPTTGPHRYGLIGVSEFGLAEHTGHTVLVKGLFIKAEPVSRVNVTSVTMVSTACAPVAK